MNRVLPRGLVTAWLDDTAAVIAPLAGGTNNESYLVESVGKRYLLRLYRVTADPERIRYEHRLLSRLSTAGLPLAVPAPLPARSGDTLAATPEGVSAALFPFFPGEYPNIEDPAHVRACGAALAALDVAMASIDLPAPASGLLAFGAFPAVHPAAPDSMEVIAGLPMEGDERRRLEAIMRYLLVAAPRLRENLPGQIVHRDFDASNVLVESDRVTAVLDFEFARPDIRALDLATGLAAFAGAGWDMAQGRWRLAFAEAYLQQLPLTAAEIEAIPDLMLLARAGSLLHRAGRQRLGIGSPDRVLAQAQALLRRARWLENQGRPLVATLLSC